MANVRTNEGRARLRRLITPHGSKDIQDWAHPALDGLDIAQEMMDWVSENPLHCRRCGAWVVLETHVPPQPGDLELIHAGDCPVPKWNAWKGEPHD